ncbi:uncharacterized protein LOC110008797 [Jatropha curcas]|uniref:uncharacterized protein LOC110008797 n=1 Tax=Jatropha curcas TaxID=180498 RepID=UPI001895A865|nr:uncharacterized protein LOC110008797 [Jatropha curcas]
MDELVGRVGGRFKISLTDSTMMRIVHSAMDKAHERAQSKEGVIERLTEISKFYELAVMQLEGCLSFVQEEADSSSEISNEEVLWDLTDIRDRLIGRLKELELAIAEKDRELTKRIENELKFRQALEMKERDLDSLCAKIKLEPTKIESVEALSLGNKGVGDELILGNRVADEEFSGLKNSLDRQVWNIKHKLEPEDRRRNRSFDSIKIEQMGSEPEDRRRNRSFDSIKIEQMGSDIDILKETMDIAFGKMQNSMFFSDMEPIEQQWRSTIEKDALGILINGFVRDIQENFNVKVRGREKQVSFGLSEHLSDLMKEIKCLNDDLEALCLSQSNHEGKIYLGPRERSLSEEDIHGKPQNSTLRVEKVYQQKEVEEENTEDDAVTFVAKMIKNHESFIKKKSREAQKIKRENTGEKGCSSPKREEDLIKPRRKIQDVIIRMENLINWNAKLGESFGEYEGTDHEKSYFTRQEKSHYFTRQGEKSQIGTHSKDGRQEEKSGRTISISSNAVE